MARPAKKDPFDYTPPGWVFGVAGIILLTFFYGVAVVHWCSAVCGRTHGLVCPYANQSLTDADCRVYGGYLDNPEWFKFSAGGDAVLTSIRDRWQQECAPPEKTVNFLRAVVALVMMPTKLGVQEACSAHLEYNRSAFKTRVAECYALRHQADCYVDSTITELLYDPLGVHYWFKTTKSEDEAVCTDCDVKM